MIFLGEGFFLSLYIQATFVPKITRFLKANALLNNLEDTLIINMDWTKPPLHQSWDSIVRFEVVYHRRTYDLLVEYLGGAIFWLRTSIFLILVWSSDA